MADVDMRAVCAPDTFQAYILMVAIFPLLVYATLYSLSANTFPESHVPPEWRH